jgi:DNA-binding MarR family transcriptional regulator
VARSYLASKLGVSAPQYNILMVIAQYQHPEGIPLSEVANHLNVSVAHITNEIKKLGPSGLISSDVNPKDRRVRLVKIHPLAEKKFIELGYHQRNTNNSLFANLTKRINQLRGILKKLNCGFLEALLGNSKSIKIIQIKDDSDY